MVPHNYVSWILLVEFHSILWVISCYIINHKLIVFMEFSYIIKLIVISCYIRLYQVISCYIYHKSTINHRIQAMAPSCRPWACSSPRPRWLAPSPWRPSLGLGPWQPLMIFETRWNIIDEHIPDYILKYYIYIYLINRDTIIIYI